MNFKPAKLNDADGDLSKRWFVYFFFRDPDTGKYIRFREWISSRLVTRSARYEKAKELRNSINKRLKLGFNPFVAQDRGQTSLLQSLDYYLDTKSKSLRPRTIISYRSYLNHFKEWLMAGKYKLISTEAITYHLAEEYMDFVWEDKKPAPRTWNNTLQALRTCFNFMIKKEFCQVNPFFRLEEVPVEETEIIAFNMKELEIISRELPIYNHNLYVIALLVYNCFLRPQEIVRLQVHHLLEATHHLAIPGKVSKNKKNHVISVPDQVLQEIAKMDLDYPSNYYVFGLHLERNINQNYPTRIAEVWREFAKNHGIEKGIYSFKHTGNGMALDAGANVRDLQLQNRHSSLEETQKYLDRFRKVPSRAFTINFPRL